MKFKLILILICTLFITTSCEQRAVIHITKEPLSKKHFYNLTHKSNLTFQIESILRKNKTNEYFSIPYFLIPTESTKLFASKFSNNAYLSQIQSSISGKKHFKYFLMPENARELIQELKGRFTYIDPNESEFFATKVNNDDHKMIIWSKKNLDSPPFIVSLENRPSLSLDLIEANQNSIPLIKQKNELKNLNISFENISIRFDLPLKKLPNLQQILKIDALLLDENESKLSKTNDVFLRNVKHKVSHLNFIKDVLHNDFIKIINEVTLRNGFVLNPELGNLNLTYNKQKKFYITLSEIENIYPDLLLMDKQNNHTSFYNKRMNEEKFKLFETANIFKNFLDNYSERVFVAYTRFSFENKMINYKEMNDLNKNFKKDIQLLYENYLSLRLDAKKIKIVDEIKNKETALSYIDLKKHNREWVDLGLIRTPANDIQFYFSENAFYMISNNYILGYGFYNQNEKYLFNIDKIIPNLKQD